MNETKNSPLKKLVIIGNGFDLAHEMKTSYKHYLLWQINNDFRNSKSKIESENQFIKFKKTENLDEFKEIEDFVDFKKKHSEKIEYINPFFKKWIEDIAKHSNWVDIESFYYGQLKKSFTERQYNLLPFNVNETFGKIKIELENYLNTQVSMEKIDAIQTHFDNLSKNISFIAGDKKPIYILNFNYTGTCEQYIKKYKDLFEVNYIHGKLNDVKNPIVFGYGDKTDPAYSRFIKDIRYKETYLKNFKTNLYNNTTDNYENHLGFIDSGSFEVYIMGHSCGVSDKFLLQQIFKHDNCKSIIIRHYERQLDDMGELTDDFTLKKQIIGDLDELTSNKIFNKIRSKSEALVPILK